MLFSGLQKLTLLDYPGHVACTVFTQGCGYRCPFCQNSSLLDACRAPENPVLEEDILAFLKKRQGTLDGICITGGEPLMHEELTDFLLSVRKLGFLVKLDTNGSQPERLEALLRRGLIDMAAMDIKNSLTHYARTVGLAHFDTTPVQQSARLLMEGRIPFEFRTTVVDELHSEEDMREIGLWLQGSENYFLQYYVDSDNVLRRGLHAPSPAKMEACAALLRSFIPNTRIRGD